MCHPLFMGQKLLTKFLSNIQFYVTDIIQHNGIISNLALTNQYKFKILLNLKYLFGIFVCFIFYFL